MSDMEKVVDQIMKQIGSTNVNAIFGQPCQFEDKVVMPVGKIAYGLGGGGGKTEKDNKDNEEQQGEENKGMGFGMGAKVLPIGYITITRDNVSFQPVMDIAPICTIWSIAAAVSMVMLVKLMAISKIMKIKQQNKR